MGRKTRRPQLPPPSIRSFGVGREVTSPDTLSRLLYNQADKLADRYGWQGSIRELYKFALALTHGEQPPERLDQVKAAALYKAYQEICQQRGIEPKAPPEPSSKLASPPSLPPSDDRPNQPNSCGKPGNKNQKDKLTERFCVIVGSKAKEKGLTQQECKLVLAYARALVGNKPLARLQDRLKKLVEEEFYSYCQAAGINDSPQLRKVTLAEFRSRLRSRLKRRRWGAEGERAYAYALVGLIEQRNCKTRKLSRDTIERIRRIFVSCYLDMEDKLCGRSLLAGEQEPWFLGYVEEARRARETHS